MAAAPTATTATGYGKDAGSDDTQGAHQSGSVVPFVRGSGKGKYKFFSKSGLTLTTATQDLGPIDIKAYDYMRSLLVTFTTTTVGGATGTAQADAPFNAFTNIAVKQPNGQTMYQVSSGYHAAMIQKYGFYRGYNDPRADPTFFVNGSWATFALRIPFELDLRDALGALPNKDAAAPFSLELTLNTLTNVFGSGQGTSPTFTVEAWLEAYDQPPTTLNGQPVQTTPPNMNTLQRWTEQNITMSSGQFDARVRKLGNYLRVLLPIMKNSSGVRIGTAQNGTTASLAGTNFADPVQIVLDEDVKDNKSVQDWIRQTWEIYGYGGVFPGTATTVASGVATAGNSTGATPNQGQDAPGGLDTGVYPIPYFCDTRDITENTNFYLPTIESEDYLLRGSWGSAVSKLATLVCEVLPQGDIFG
jgi:hypothetical protein